MPSVPGYVECPRCHTAVPVGQPCWYCAMREHQQKGEKNRPVEAGRFEVCPQCGVRALQRTNGCHTCLSCGFSKCDY